MESVIAMFSCGSTRNDNIINIIHHDIGEKVYDNILKELTSDRYVETDFRDLAKQLNVFHYYYDNLKPKIGDDNKSDQIKRRRHGSKTQNYISTSGIAIHKIFERWAMEYPDMVAKKTLYIAFCEIPSMRHIVKLLEVDYDYDCEVSNVCYMTKLLEVDHDSVTSEEVDTAREDLTSTGHRMLPFIHLNLRHGRFSAEKLLGDKPEGTYLVRPSQNRLGDYSVSLKLKDRTAHIRVEAVATKMGTKYGKFESRRYTGSPEEDDENLFLTLGDLINHYMHHHIFANQKLTNIIMPPQTQKEHMGTSPKSSSRKTIPTLPDSFTRPLQSLNHPLHPLPFPPRNKQYLRDNMQMVQGESPNWEHLQKLINLKEKDKLNLPTVSMIIKATCLIEYDGAEGDWGGTAFLATINNFPGVVLFSAGHNFAENGKIIRDFENVSLSFNNPEGIRSMPSKTIHSEGNIIRAPLSKFLKPKSTMVVTIHGEQLIMKGQKSSKKSVDIHLDYFALVLEDPFEKVKLREVMGLDFLTCATGDSLEPKLGEPLACFGHPFVQELDKKGKENRGNYELYPMRFSHGNEKKLEDNGLFTDEYKKQRIFYDLDTQGGSSGCEVIGRNYSVKGIHIGKITGQKLNAAQPIKSVLKDLEELGLINRKNRQTANDENPTRKSLYMRFGIVAREI